MLLLTLVGTKFYVELLLYTCSAADLYITKHFDAFTKKAGGGQLEMLRVYFQNRRINTVNSVVRKYCMFTDDHRSFATPRREHILQKQVLYDRESS